MSTSEKNPAEKSEKHRIWELEEQLDDEQYAHRKTKSALRYAQDKLEQMSNEGKNQKMESSKDDKNLKEEKVYSSKTIEDLCQEVSRLVQSRNETVKSMEMLKSENEGLKNRQLESKSTILDLEKKIGSVEAENKFLKNSKEIQERQLTERKIAKKQPDENSLKTTGTIENLERRNKDLVAKREEAKKETVKSMEKVKLENESLKNKEVESNASSKSIILDLEKKIGTVETENQSLKNSSKVREKQLTENLERADNLERQNQDVKLLLQGKNEEIETVNEIVKDQSEKIGILEKEIHDLREENVRREQLRENMRKMRSDQKKSETTSRIEYLEKMNKDLVAKLEEANKENVKLVGNLKSENEDLKNRQLESYASFKNTIASLEEAIRTRKSVSIAEEIFQKKMRIVQDHNSSAVHKLCLRIRGMTRRSSPVHLAVINEIEWLVNLLVTVVEQIQDFFKKTRPFGHSEEEVQLMKAMPLLLDYKTSRSEWIRHFFAFESSAAMCFSIPIDLEHHPNAGEAAKKEEITDYETMKSRFDVSSAYLKNNTPNSHWIQQVICNEIEYLKNVEKTLEGFSMKTSEK